MTNDTNTTSGETKHFGGYLVINWRDETTPRFRKTKQGIGVNELAIPLEIEVNVPEVEVPTIEADIDVPAPEVEEAIRYGREDLGDTQQ